LGSISGFNHFEFLLCALCVQLGGLCVEGVLTQSPLRWTLRRKAKTYYNDDMRSWVWVLVLVGLLTLLGSVALLFITLKYYWGARGTPPLTGDERRTQKEEELALRAKQIEDSERKPVIQRSPDFLDNRKRL